MSAHLNSELHFIHLFGADGWMTECVLLLNIIYICNSKPVFKRYFRPPSCFYHVIITSLYQHTIRKETGGAVPPDDVKTCNVIERFITSIKKNAHCPNCFMSLFPTVFKIRLVFVSTQFKRLLRTEMKQVK